MPNAAQTLSQTLGLELRPEWIAGLPAASSATCEQLLSAFLFEDISQTTSGALPENWQVRLCWWPHEQQGSFATQIAVVAQSKRR